MDVAVVVVLNDVITSRLCSFYHDFLNHNTMKTKPHWEDEQILPAASFPRETLLHPWQLHHYNINQT